MRDEIDSRMWVEHHEQFSEFVDRALVGLRSAAGRLASWDGTTHQLLALGLSFVITLMTFNATTTHA
jgi:hypothetical protein